MNLKMYAKLKTIMRNKGFEDHKAPVSRRDFVKLGLIAGGGALMPASFMTRVYAAGERGTHLPFLVFDLAGGAGLPANFLVGQAGGPEDLCADYTKLGWNPRNSRLDKTFGLPMSQERSQILAGLNATLPSALRTPNQNLFKMASMW